MRFLSLPHRHSKIIHISGGITLGFIAILYIFFSISGVSAAVIPIETKNVSTLSSDEITAETTNINLQKSGLESQMVAAQEKYTSNRTLQISLYSEIDTYSGILSDWKVIERINKKYTDTLKDIETIDAKILEKNKETDVAKKTSLESKKDQIKADLKERIALLKEKDKTLSALTVETLTSDIIVSGKTQSEEEYNKKKDDIKAARAEKKAILKEKSSIKKVIRNAGSYLTKLAKELEKKTKALANGQNTPPLSSLNSNILNINDTELTGTLNTGTLNTGTLNTGTLNTGTLNTGTLNTGTLGGLNTGTLNTGTLGGLNTTNQGTIPVPITALNCLGTRPGNSFVLSPGFSTNIREWSYASVNSMGPLPGCVFSCNGSYNSVLKVCN